MKTEQMESAKSQQQPVVYATLEEALEAKMERTKLILRQLNPEARIRLIKEGKQGREDLPSS